MAVDHIRYDLLTQQALRGVVRTVLADIAKNGLPGEHHFYIAFNTQAPGVRISPRLREQYPEEMTIILQHQFWDLMVNNDGFEVGLSFGGAAERLGIPFDAIKGFFDPSVQFGLQFETEAAAEQTADAPDKTAPPSEQSAADETPPAALPTSSPPSSETPEAAPEEQPANGGAEVVSLDRFRKK